MGNPETLSPSVGPSEPVVPAEPVVPGGPAEPVGGGASRGKNRDAMDLIDLDAAWSSEWLSDQQKADPDIGRLHEMLTTKNPRPERDEVAAMSPELKTYVTVLDSLVMSTMFSIASSRDPKATCGSTSYSHLEHSEPRYYRRSMPTLMGT